MTHHLSDEQLGREIREYLAWETERAVNGPDAMEMVGRVSGRVGAPSVRVRTPRLLWLLLTGLLIAALGAAGLVGASLRLDGGKSYEAVFLRFELRSFDLLVIGVDMKGQERTIATVPGARLSPAYPVGAVSTTGLLAIPRPWSESRWLVHWEIVDLGDPEAVPIVIDRIEQDIEQLPSTPYYTPGSGPAPFWGPGDRLALPWYERRTGGAVHWQWSFVDGRTGATTMVELPSADLMVLPAWASDGSGVLVGRWCQESGCDRRGMAPSGVLRPDGSVAEGDLAVAPITSSRRYRADGATVEVTESGKRLVHDGTFELAATDGEITDVAWTAEGDGLWVAVRPSGGEGDLRIERVVPRSEPRTLGTVYELEAGEADPAGSRLQGHFIGLAPDDSMLAVSLDRVTGTEGDGSTHPVHATALVAPAHGESFEIEGSFVGWMERH